VGISGEFFETPPPLGPPPFSPPPPPPPQNSSWHCRGRKFDVTIMVQEQLTVFTFLNSKDGTFACASGSDIMAGLTVAWEQL